MEQLLKHKIDFCNYKQMAKNCWLFLTNDKMPKSAEIKKEAFLHEVGVMIEIAASYAKKQSVESNVPTQVMSAAEIYHSIEHVKQPIEFEDSFLNGEDELERVLEDNRNLQMEVVNQEKIIEQLTIFCDALKLLKQ